MKRLLYFLALATTILSCQKEIDFVEDLPPVVTNAVFSFSGSPNACTVATVEGFYGTGTALSATNTVTIEVNVTTAGAYTISTPTVNGYKFSATGAFANTGVQTVKLTGSGTPAAAQTDAFAPAMSGVTGCSFNIVVITPAPAVFALLGSPGACTDIGINGVYELNSDLTSSNSITVKVDVSSTGTFSLSTNTVAGMSFSKSGGFATTGVQTLTLQGSGKPTATGSQLFTLGTNGCTFSIPVVGPAVYSFTGAPNACLPVVIAGNYTVASSLSASHTVTVEANVTSTGAFNITTTAGGMQFSKTGTFTNTGLQPVILQGSGTPTTAGINNFTLGTGGCTFSITVAAAPVSSGTFQCKIDGVLITFNDRAHAETLDDFFDPPVPYLFLEGYTAPPDGNEIPYLHIFINKNDNSAVGAGTYNEKSFVLPTGGYRIEIDYAKVNPDLSVTLWNTSSNIIPPANPPFTIIITSATATRIKGTFSGKLTNIVEGSTSQKTITEGVFDLPVSN